MIDFRAMGRGIRRMGRWIGASAALLGVALFLPWTSGAIAAETLQPFVLAKTVSGPLDAAVEQARSALERGGFRIIAQTQPYRQEESHVDAATVIVFTRSDVLKVAGKQATGGFIAPLRLSVTEVDGQVQVAYVNPTYFAHAYRLDDDLAQVSSDLEDAFPGGQGFGSEKGMAPGKLRKYHYSFGMHYFDEPYELATFGSHGQAVEKVREHLSNNTVGISQVYELAVPNSEQVVFGVLRRPTQNTHSDMDDTWIMSIADFEARKKTAYLPYEILVTGNKVIAMHAQFRMAVHFPDMPMFSVGMRLMNAMNVIGDGLEAAVKDE